MQKVEFIRVKSKIKNYGLIRGTKSFFDNYKEIIESKLRDGCKYEGFVPAIIRGNGEITSIDLIFTKEGREKK